MVAALTKKGTGKPVRRIQINKNSISKQELPDFVTQNTLQFFKTMNISDEFLKKEPSAWNENMNYLEAKNKIEKLMQLNTELP